jgi:hypothetical protein
MWVRVLLRYANSFLSKKLLVPPKGGTLKLDRHNHFMSILELSRFFFVFVFSYTFHCVLTRMVINIYLGFIRFVLWSNFRWLMWMAVPPFLRYGKYCGLLYSGCPGEKPCDGLDACCMKHDACIQSKNSKYSSMIFDLSCRNILVYSKV